MILFISDSRESIPIAYAIAQEGVPVDFFVHDPQYRTSFDGLMPKIDLRGLEAALKRCQVVIFDITLPMSDQPRDAALMLKFGLSAKAPGVFGGLAEKLRKTHVVIGGGKWTEHIELDREDGIKLAQECGFAIPEYKVFQTCKDAVRFLDTDGKKDQWVIKPCGNKDLDWTFPETFKGEARDILENSLPIQYGDKLEVMLQKFVGDGVEVSSELWWDGDHFLHPNRTLERKKLMDGNLSCATGSQSNNVWLCKDQEGIVFKEMQHLAPYLKKSKYLGCIDANCIITKDGRPWFLEWTPRFGWSALYCFMEFIKGNIGDFFLSGFEAKMRPGFVSSELVSLWPYPSLDKKTLEKRAKLNLINHSIDLDGMWWQDVLQDEKCKLRCAGADGIIGVMANHSGTLEGSIGGLYKKLKPLQIVGNIQYRTEHDHQQQAKERMAKIESWKLNLM